MIAPITAFLQETKVQIACIVLTSFYIGTLLIMSYQRHSFAEEVLRLEEPSQFAKTLANNVEMGLHFNSFPHFSIKDGKFTFDGILWFKFDKGAESIETLETFTIKNMLMHGDKQQLYKSTPIIKILDEKVLVSYHIQTTFMAEVNFKKFPMGDHRINLTIENREATANELLYSIKPENITFSNELLLESWRPIAVHTDSGVVRAKVGSDKTSSSISFPSANIAIDLENTGARGLISLYFPLFILFFIGLLSLTIGIFDTARLGIIASSFPTLVLFRFVIDAVSPEVGYATHIDFIYYILVILSFLILFFQTYVILFIERAKAYTPITQAQTKNKLELMNTLLLIGIMISLIVIMTFDFFQLT